MSELTNTVAVVTGAGRGFGAAIATALIGAGARVVGIARTETDLRARADELGPRFTPLTADATDEAVAAGVIKEHRPSLLVLNAGAIPTLEPLTSLTWTDIERNWQTDTRHAFVWLREALTAPLAPGSLVVTMSSGAALHGSPVSGGYAGAKAAIRFLARYAAGEAADAGLGVRFVTLLPQLTPTTTLGIAGACAYAARKGVDLETFTAGMESILTPETVGRTVLELVTEKVSVTEGNEMGEYVLTGAGRRPVP